jgi:cell division inhibitor SepF
MPGAMKKMGVYLGLVEDDEGVVDNGESYDRPPYERAPRSRPADYGPDTRYARANGDGGGPATAVAAREWPGDDQGNGYPADYEEYQAYRITTLHPRTYNEARTIGEHFRSGTPVIMNLSEMDDSDAKRLVDFAAGLTFGLHGRIERVTAKVFLLSPHNVTVTAQDKARIAEGGFFNQS